MALAKNINPVRIKSSTRSVSSKGEINKSPKNPADSVSMESAPIRMVCVFSLMGLCFNVLEVPISDFLCKTIKKSAPKIIRTINTFRMKVTIFYQFIYTAERGCLKRPIGLK